MAMNQSQWQSFLSMPASCNYGISDASIINWFLGTAIGQEVSSYFGGLNYTLIESQIKPIFEAQGISIHNVLLICINEGGGLPIDAYNGGPWINHFNPASTNPVSAATNDANYIAYTLTNFFPNSSIPYVPTSLYTWYSGLADGTLGRYYIPATGEISVDWTAFQNGSTNPASPIDKMANNISHLGGSISTCSGGNVGQTNSSPSNPTSPGNTGGSAGSGKSFTSQSPCMGMDYSTFMSVLNQFGHVKGNILHR